MTAEHFDHGSALIERFGRWPSFHDAEVLAVRLDDGSRTGLAPSIELDVHVFAMSDEVDDDGSFVLRSHTLAVLRFDGVRDVELEDFGAQNALDGLEVERAADGALTVALPSNNGLSGAFACDAARVVAVEPFTPGPHSLYGQPREPVPRLAAERLSAEDGVILHADERGVRLLAATLRSLTEPGSSRSLSPPPGEGTALGSLTLLLVAGPARVSVAGSDLRVRGGRAALDALAAHLEEFADHNDLTAPGMHTHVDRGWSPPPEWLAEDSVPLTVASWPR